ncbi:MAG: hypothetical protein ACRDSZ_23785 [Pseudonocardiaceae bacterium]
MRADEAPFIEEPSEHVGLDPVAVGGRGDRLGLVEAPAAPLAVSLDDPRLDLGVSTGETGRPWPAVAADMDRFNTKLRPACDHAAQGVVLPGLLREAHTLYVTDSEHRADVLRALMDCSC